MPTLGQVKIIDSLETMSEETFGIHFSERTWSATLTDGTSVDLKAEGASCPVPYGERMEYAELFKKARMDEFTEQVGITIACIGGRMNVSLAR